MDRYIIKKLIAIFLSGSVFIAIVITIAVLNKTNAIEVPPPNTKDIETVEKGGQTNLKVSEVDVVNIYKV